MKTLYCGCACAHAFLARAAMLLTLAVAMASPSAAVGQILTLPDALSRAAAADPALSAAMARVDAAEAGIDQADRRLNPSVGLTVENFAGTRTHQGVSGAETTLSYEQVLELGGKRAARTALARAERDAVAVRRDVRMLDLFRDVETAWVEVLAAEARIVIQEARLEATTRLAEETERRVDAARDPAFAGARTEALVAQAQIGLDLARDAALSARAALATYWSGTPNFAADMGAFENILEPAVLDGDFQIADLDLLQAQERTATARISLEEAWSVRDPTLYAGVRRYELTDEFALVAGVSLALPLYDDNSGNIARARAERLATERDLAALRATRQREILRLNARAAASRIEAQRLAAEIIPQSEEALELAQEGFAQGAFDYIDLLEAERALADARSRQVEVLRTYHLDMTELNRLTGRHAGILQNEENR